MAKKQKQVLRIAGGGEFKDWAKRKSETNKYGIFANDNTLATCHPEGFVGGLQGTKDPVMRRRCVVERVASVRRSCLEEEVDTPSLKLRRAGQWGS